MKSKKENGRPTIEQSAAYQGAFDFLNERLFSGSLGSVMLVLSRNSERIGGYFSPGRWIDENGEKTIHEIGVNANRMTGLEVHELLGKLVHEMCHLWQYQHGKPSRQAYHNAEWIDKAKSLGLIVEGSGQTVSTSLEPQGLAAMAIADMPDEAIWPWLANSPMSDPQEGQGGGGEKPPEPPKPQPKSGKRERYTCPVCGECSQVMIGGGRVEDPEA